MAFNADQVAEEDICEVEQLAPFLQRWPTTWVDVVGLGDAKLISQLGVLFGLHPLALEDVVHIHQRAKVDEYDQHLFIVARMPRLAEHLESEQISFFLGEHFLLTFQERADDCFAPVRARLRMGLGRIRTSGASYLAYALLDAVVDSYFPVIDAFVNRLDELDEEVGVHPSPNSIAKIHEVRGDLLLLRREIRPHREAVGELIRGPHRLLSEESQLYLRDCYDHTIQLTDIVDTYREMCGDLRDFYLSSVSHRLNETMKVLTMIATIFIPLSFMAGVFGMNFDRSSRWNMPELGWTFGYPLVLLAMLTVASGMLMFFRRKGWLGGGDSPDQRDQAAADEPGADGPGRV